MDRILSQGVSGVDVRTAQAYLNFHLAPVGFPVTTDGIFGPETRARTIEFQRRANLQQDGIIGPATKAALLSFQKATIKGTLTPGSVLPSVPNLRLNPSLRNLPDVRNQNRPATPYLRPPDWFWPPLRDHGWQIKKWEFQGGNEFDLPWSDSSPAQITVEATFLRRVDGKDQEGTLGVQGSLTPKSDDGKWNAQFYVKKGWDDLLRPTGPVSWVNPWVMGYLKTPSGAPPVIGFGAGNDVNVDLLKNSEGKTILSFVFGLAGQCDLVDLNGPTLHGKCNLLGSTGLKITIEPPSGWQGPPPGTSTP